MRIPYAPNTPPPTSSTTTHDIYTRIAARRAPRPLIPLDLALLHNPSIADGWNSLLGAIRSKTSLEAGIVELAICRVAVLNGAVYEWDVHSKLARKEGVTRGVLREVLKREISRDGGRTGEGEGGGEAEGSGGGRTEEGKDESTPTQQVVLEYTDAMTLNVAVPDEVFAKLKNVAGFDDTQCMELTAVVAAYNCVSRFLVALDVGEANGGVMEVPE